MNEDGRFIPPGPGRSAAFSNKGGFGKSALLVTGCGLLGIAAAGAIVQNLFRGRFSDTFRQELESAVSLASSPSEALAQSGWNLFELAVPFLTAIAAGAAGGALLPVLFARRGKGATAVLLPKMPRARFSIGAVRFFGAVVFVAAFLLAVREIKLDTSGPLGFLSGFGELALRFVGVLGLVMVLTGAAEVLILRHSAFRALFLNRSEYQRELRNQEGARDLSEKGRRLQRREAAP